MARSNAVSDCPVCGRAGMPLLFGLPVPAARDAAAAGEIALAGCIVFDDPPPNWACTEQHQWTDTTDERGRDELLLRILIAHGCEE